MGKNQIEIVNFKRLALQLRSEFSLEFCHLSSFESRQPYWRRKNISERILTQDLYIHGVNSSLKFIPPLMRLIWWYIITQNFYGSKIETISGLSWFLIKPRLIPKLAFAIRLVIDHVILHWGANDAWSCAQMRSLLDF